MFTSQVPMLASSDNRPAEEVLQDLDGAGTHVFDMKWDGVRALAFITRDNVTIRNRRGTNVTYRYTDVAEKLAETFTGVEAVLDGEIVAFGADGRPDFTRLSRRDRQTTVEGARRLHKSVPVTYIAFDLLWLKEDLRRASQQTRLQLLDTLYDTGRPCPQLQVSPRSTDGKRMWELVTEHNLEGLIAKNRWHTYLMGRSPDWVKIKRVQRISCIVTGWEEGKGARAGKVGALTLDLMDGDEWVSVGKVGSGFTEADLTEAMELLNKRRPHEGYLVVDVECGNVTTGGRLRFPVFKGFRHDIDAASCTIDQLKGT